MRRAKLCIISTLLPAALLLVACAGEQPVRNTVQHGAIAKQDLQGAEGKAVWYYLRTVVDVPYATGFTFAGEQSYLEKIRWDVQEKVIYARRSYDWVRDADSASSSAEQGSDPQKVQGAPVAAFAIEKHFDIIRDYNTSTGEEINKLVENEDRHWYERKFIRVDWSKNLIADHVFLVQYKESGIDPLKQEPVPYYVSDPADPDTLRIDRPAATEAVPRPTADYIDVTNKLMVTPESVTISFSDGDYRMPACYMVEDYGPDYASTDCSAQEIKVRHAFKKVEAQRDYDPLIYDDRWMERFGYFSSERRRYNKQFGQVDTERVRLANRFNIWSKVLSSQSCAVSVPAGKVATQQQVDAARAAADKACVAKQGAGSRCAELAGVLNTNAPSDEGRCTLPPGKRDGTRTIPYYLNVGFPKELVATAKASLGSWNDSFQTTAARLLYPGDKQSDAALLLKRKQAIGPIFEVRENDCSDAKVKAFLTQHPDLSAKLPADVDSTSTLKGKPLLRACSALERATAYRATEQRFTWQRIGDLRYSMLYWVGAPTRMGLLGYGPGAADPETGEIVQANAFLYGATMDWYAARAADIVGLLSCSDDKCIQQYAPGVPLKDWLALAQDKAPSSKTAGKASSRVFTQAEVEQLAGKMKTAWIKGLKLPAMNLRSLDAMRVSMRARRSALAKGKALGQGGTTTADRLAAIRGTALEAKARGHYLSGIGLGAGASTPLAGAVTPAKSSIYHWAGPGILRARRAARLRLAKRRVELASFFDDAILGLALRYKEKKQTRDQIYQDLRKRILRGLSEHELGHTLGLRHNFAASYDALNYHPAYWKLRQLDSLGGALPRYKKALSKAEREGIAGDKVAPEGLGSYQVSSVMDYGSRFNSDLGGLGFYDKAAIKFGYGQLVQVFDKVSPSVPDKYLLANVQTSIRWGEPMLFTITCDAKYYRSVHYTEYPRLVGGKAGLSAANRIDVPLSKMTTKKLSAIAPGCTIYNWGGLWDSDVPVDNTGRFEVPYRFCSDEFESASPECSAFDAGADMYEQTTDTIDRYNAYYLFNNLKLGRTGLSLWGYEDRIYYRFLEPLRSSMQFYTLIRGDLTGDPRGASWLGDTEIEDFFKADDGYGPWTLAVDRSLNFLLELLATPEIGQYWIDPSNGKYEQYQLYDANDNPLPPDLTLSAPSGKYHTSSWDFDSGYYWYDKMTHVGIFHDKWLALWALTDPDTYFLGRDTSSDLRQYAINYSRLYPDLITRYLRGVLTEDWSLTALHANNKKLVARDFTLAATPPAGALPVDPQLGYSLQFYAGLLGVALLPRTFDTSFIDSARIWVTGASDAITPTGPKVCFVDPSSKKEYCASSYPDTSNKETGVGAAMLLRAKALAAKAALPAALPQDKLALAQYIDSLDLMRSITTTFAYTPY